MQHVFNKKTMRGFHVIELVLVLLIFTVLVSITFPKFMQFQMRAKQSEAKDNLKSIYTSLQAHFAETGSYDCGFCGFVPKSGSRRYHYSVNNVQDTAAFGGPDKQASYPCMASSPPPGPNTFKAMAAANLDSDTTCDIWTIDQDNNLVHASDDINH